MAISADWIAQNTATTGTGTITLGTALAGFIRLQDDSRITDGALVNYTIEDGNNREMGIGTYTASGGTLARTVVQRTLVSGTFDDSSPTAISLSGSAVVRCSAVADDRNFRGCILSPSSAFSVPSSNAVNVTTLQDSVDTDNFHDNSTNPERITMQTGIKLARFTAYLRFDSGSAVGNRAIYIVKNDITYLTRTQCVAGGGDGILTTTGVIQVAPTDYFTMRVFQNSGAAINLATDDTVKFIFEVIE